MFPLQLKPKPIIYEEWMIAQKIQPTKDGKFVDTKSLLTDFSEDIRANFNKRNTAYL
jgi:hypothetical protein